MMFMGLKYSFSWGSDEREFKSMKMMIVSENQSSRSQVHVIAILGTDETMLTIHQSCDGGGGG